MSTNNIEQNGRQPPLPNQPTPPSDPRPGYESEQQKPICRKYVWGTCTKNTLCKFRHELVFEEMKKILKFCHDYQNKQGCTRLDCSYLHTTSEEENLFLSTGQLPQVLQARYAAMSETNSCMPNFEGIPQMVMFVTPPPPPPPPAPLMTAVAAAPPPPPPVQPAPFRPVQQPPPPPPPPPTIPPAASAVQAPNVFTAPPPQYPPNQPPPLFDPSRPPPPFQPKENLKRRRDEIEAGSSKIAKLEEPKSDAPCDSCIQREIRIELFKEQMGKLEQEEEYQSLIYKKKLEEFESGKEVLRSLVSSELYRILEEHIEGGPQVQDILAQFTQSPFLLGTSTVPKQFLLQLLEYVFNNSKHLMESPVSPSLMQTLTTLSRIQNPINHSSSDRVQTVLDMLRNSNAADRNKSVESRSIEPLNIQENRAGFSNNNGISRFSNGQKLESSGSVPNPNASRCPCPPISTARTYTAGPGSGALTSSGNRPQAPSTGNYPSYHPTVPPPPANRPYYGSPSNGTRTGAGSTAQIPVRSAAVTASTISQSYQYMMGRFPHPSHYYPPFQ